MHVKYGILPLGLSIGLSACSPPAPGPQDLQNAIEVHFSHHVNWEEFRRHNKYNQGAMVRCDPITSFAMEFSDGRKAKVQFSFSPLSEINRDVIQVELYRNPSASPWRILRNGNIKNFPCRVVLVEYGVQTRKFREF